MDDILPFLPENIGIKPEDLAAELQPEEAIFQDPSSLAYVSEDFIDCSENMCSLLNTTTNTDTQIFKQSLADTEDIYINHVGYPVTLTVCNLSDKPGNMGTMVYASPSAQLNKLILKNIKTNNKIIVDPVLTTEQDWAKVEEKDRDESECFLSTQSDPQSEAALCAYDYFNMTSNLYRSDDIVINEFTSRHYSCKYIKFWADRHWREQLVNSLLDVIELNSLDRTKYEHMIRNVYVSTECCESGCFYKTITNGKSKAMCALPAILFEIDTIQCSTGIQMTHRILKIIEHMNALLTRTQDPTMKGEDDFAVRTRKLIRNNMSDINEKPIFEDIKVKVPCMYCTLLLSNKHNQPTGNFVKLLLQKQNKLKMETSILPPDRIAIDGLTEGLHVNTNTSIETVQCERLSSKGQPLYNLCTIFNDFDPNSPDYKTTEEQ